MTDLSLSKTIEDWILGTNGWFSYKECDDELSIHDSNSKSNRRQVFRRLLDKHVIERHGRDNKLFRFINKDVRVIDFKTKSKRNPLNIKWPFGIEKLFNCYPKNIVVVAGAPNAGKTAFLLNTVHMNQYNFPIFYQSSEMGVDEAQLRLSNFDDMDLEDWNFAMEERCANFHDVIRPDAINIIDFMEISEDFFIISEMLRKIYENLNDGIAVVALQKNKGTELGRGGTFGLEKPRLYLSMDNNRLHITKAKNWANPYNNPNGLSLNFKISRGCEFEVTNDWH